MQALRIKSIKQIGLQNTLDFEVDHPDHNFLAEGIVVSNSHSLSYAMMGAITCYLKFKYPINFYKSLLNRSKEEPKPLEEIGIINQEMRLFNIPLLPPDLVLSDLDFKIEGHSIRFGLGSIKGISTKVSNALMNFNRDKVNRFQMFDNAQESKINISVLSALIMSGAMDSLGATQNRMFITLQAQLWYVLTTKEKNLAHEYGKDFNYDLFKVYNHLRVTKDSKGNLLIKDSRAETIKKKMAPKKEIYEANSRYRELAYYIYERTLLGYSYSYQLKNIFNKFEESLTSIEEVQWAQDKDRVHFVGIVQASKLKTSKNGNKYADYYLDDESGTIKVMIFNSRDNAKCDKHLFAHGDKVIEENRIVYVIGQKIGDVVFADSIADQATSIYLKWLDLKKDKEEQLEEKL